MFFQKKSLIKKKQLFVKTIAKKNYNKSNPICNRLSFLKYSYLLNFFMAICKN